MRKRNSRLGVWAQVLCMSCFSCVFSEVALSQEILRVGSEAGSPDATKTAAVCGAWNRNKEITNEDAPTAEISNMVPEGAVLKLYLSDSIRLSKVSPGTRIEAVLGRPLFSGNHVAVPAGSPVQVEISGVKKVKARRSAKEKIAAGFNRVFNPLDHGSPAEYSLQLAGATVSTGQGCTLPLSVTFLRTTKVFEVEPDGKVPRDANAAAPEATRKRVSRQVLLAQLNQAVEVPAFAAIDGQPVAKNTTAEGEKGWHARALLLIALSASSNHEGDVFQARLTEPTQAGNSFLPAGALIEGHVGRDVRPRWLSRPGVLVLKVDRAFSSDGTALRVSGSLEKADADSSSRFVMDEEGTMRGRKPGIGAAAVDIGIAYTVGKVSDDISEAPIRALGASMSDTAVANAARYVGLGTATVFLLTRHGRDVKLPKYSEIGIYFGRNPEPDAK